MNFELTKKSDYNLIISKVDKIDATNAPELRDIFTQCQNNSSNKIIVDLSQSKYCDSSGLSAILAGHRFCRDTNGKFIVAGAQPMVSKLITIAQLDKVLSLATSVDEAEKIIA